MKKIKYFLPYLYYLVLALLILYPLLFQGGYIFALDMVFAPHFKNLSSVSDSSFSFLGALKFFNLFLPTDVIQKLILLAIIFIAGISAHKLVSTKSTWPKYFAGTFYIFNPFLYERFWAGQYLFCLAYALAPFALRTLITFLEKPSWQKALKLSIWLTVLNIFALHSTYLFLLVIMVLAICFLIQKRSFLILKKEMFFLGLFVIFSFILNAFWLLPIFLGKNALSSMIGNFSLLDFKVFAPLGDAQYGLFFNLTSLYGFWKEDVILLAKDQLIFWPIFTLIFLALAILGFWYLFRQKGKKWLAFGLAAIFILSIFLASGVANTWLYGHLPFYKGMRDTQKFISLTCLAYIYLGSAGIQLLLEKIKLRAKRVQYAMLGLVFILVLLPILATYTFLNGLDGQFFTSDYPPDWYEANDILNLDKSNFRVLMLPWHGYLSFDFSSYKVIANPAYLFFDKTIVQATNIERGELYSHSTNPEDELIEKALNQPADLAKTLTNLNIKYIILAKTVDFENYGYLSSLPEITTIFDGTDLTIFKVDLQ